MLFTTIASSQISALSDEFNSTTLDASWNLFQPQYYQTPISINNGFMEMNLDDALCNQTCVWWVDMNAGMIYKNVTGDFDVVTAVYAKQKNNPTQDIDRWTQLAGLIARNPASTSSGNENYVFNVAGIRFDNPSIELKSTINNLSSVSAFTNNMSGTAAEVRIVREDALFSLYSRPIGSSIWVFRGSYNRPDLPATLQVGLIAYVFDAYPGNLLAQFDYIRFSEVLNNDKIEPHKNDIYIYPNPASSELNIEINERVVHAITFSIYDALGKKIFEKPLSYSNNTIAKLNLSTLNIAAGTYFVKLKIDGRYSGIYKLIKD